MKACEFLKYIYEKITRLTKTSLSGLHQVVVLPKMSRKKSFITFWAKFAKQVRKWAVYNYSTELKTEQTDRQTNSDISTTAFARVQLRRRCTGIAQVGLRHVTSRDQTVLPVRQYRYTSIYTWEPTLRWSSRSSRCVVLAKVARLSWPRQL